MNANFIYAQLKHQSKIEKKIKNSQNLFFYIFSNDKISSLSKPLIIIILYAIKRVRCAQTLPNSIFDSSDSLAFFSYCAVSRVSTRTVHTWRYIVNLAFWFLTKWCRLISCFILERPDVIMRLYRLKSMVCPPWMWKYSVKELTWR